MAKHSAGILMFRRSSTLEVLLVHPGGPFWAKKDLGAWFIPKGEVNEGEDELAAAKREFHEETGLVASEPLIPLGSITQKGGKIVTVWAFEGDCDPSKCKSNTFEMEWPPKSGKKQTFPEVDRAEFFAIEEARRKILPSQLPLLDAMEKSLSPSPP